MCCIVTRNKDGRQLTSCSLQKRTGLPDTSFLPPTTMTLHVKHDMIRCLRSRTSRIYEEEHLEVKGQHLRLAFKINIRLVCRKPGVQPVIKQRMKLHNLPTRVKGTQKNVDKGVVY